MQHSIYSMRGTWPLALTLVTSLSACGGGGGGDTPAPSNADKPNIGNSSENERSIGGTIKGNSASVTLALNAIEQTFTGPDFTFDTKIEDGDAYLVSFVSTPADQKCSVSNGFGKATTDITNIAVTCTAPITYYRFNDAGPSGQLNTGDYNGDGIEDLVFSISTYPGHALGSDKNLLRALYGDGSGAFGNHTDYITTGSSPTKRGNTSASADYNNDGIDDLAESVVNHQLVAYAGVNTNNFSALFSSPTGFDDPMISFDIDGNGDDDFIALNMNGCSPTWKMFTAYTNEAGLISPKDIANVCGNSFLTRPHNLSHGDVNGDGHADLIVIGDKTSNFPIQTQELGIIIYMGDGAGNFSDPTKLIGLSDDLYTGNHIFDITSKDITTGDFNADGNLDMAITSSTSFLQIMLGDGAGDFTPGSRVVVGAQPIHVIAADFDKDGHLDLVSANDSAKTVQISYGKGDGTFGDLTQETGYTEFKLQNDVSLYDMRVADFNGNTSPDIAVADRLSEPEGGFVNGSIIVILDPGQ